MKSWRYLRQTEKKNHTYNVERGESFEGFKRYVELIITSRIRLWALENCKM